MVHEAKHAVMMLVSRRVKTGHEAEFERVMEQFIDTAVQFPGCLGGQLVHPGDEVDIDDDLYHAVLAFTDPENLRAWQNSPERLLGLAAAAAYIEGQAVVREVSGLAHWFQAATPRQVAPPRWKVAVVTWFGIFPTVYLLFVLLGGVLGSWPLLARIALLTVLVVTLMTWVVAPQLTRLFKPWLYPSSKSRS